VENKQKITVFSFAFNCFCFKLIKNIKTIIKNYFNFSMKLF
jgi:hypothetical protein